MSPLVLVGGVGAVGGAAWLGRWYLKRRKAMQGAKRVLGYTKGVPREMTVVPVLPGGTQYMELNAALALRKLLQAAEAAGHRLTLTSGWRSNEKQRELYQLYLAGTGNLAAAPGYSNHQGGISMDLGGVGSFETEAYAWLAKNAAEYGFKNDVTGEYWHWTYKGKGVA